MARDATDARDLYDELTDDCSTTRPSGEPR